MSNAVLVGNSNVGKTTLFNTLTRGDEHTGNWAGVTVEAKSGNADGFTVTDLPGIYALGCFSMEEAVSRDYLEGHRQDKIFNVLECAHLSVNLYLTLQMIEMGLSPVLLVNMLGEVTAKGGEFYKKPLADALGVEVAVIDARQKSAASVVAGYMDKTLPRPKMPPYVKTLPLDKIAEVSGTDKRDIGALIRIFEGEYVFDDKTVGQKIDRLLSSYGDRKQYMARLRYGYIDKIVFRALRMPKTAEKKSLLSNRYATLAVFALLLGAVFWLTFASYGPGGLCVALIERLLEGLKGVASAYLSDVPPWLASFVLDAVIEGVGVVAKFLPQVVLLFFFLNMLEDTGYISRAAFLLDGPLSKIGLSGKSVFTLLLCLGCNTTAVATSGNLGDKETQRRTLLMAPFFPCSAKLPVFLTVMTLAAPLFDGLEIVLIALLYVVCLVAAVALAGLMSMFGKNQPKNDFVLELSPLRMPSFGRVIKSVRKSVASFAARLAGILFFCVALAWLLRSFDLNFNYLPADMAENSILAWIGKGASFLFEPIGIGDWRICVALILGVTAKEVVAGTLILLFGSSFGAITWQAAVSIMLFTALYVPCVATVAMIKKESGAKTAAMSVIINIATAYGVCFVFYNFAVAFDKSLSLGICAFVVVAVVATALYLVLKYKGRCHGCGRCRCEKFDMR